MKIKQNKIPGRCTECGERSKGFFCDLPEAASAELHSMEVSKVYKRGSTIFMEGQPARGIFLLCSGRVKLSTYSEEGKAIILRFAEPGEILGLGAVISATHYEKMAQASDDCTTAFIKRKDFLEFVQTHHEAALNALRQMSRNYHKAHLQICSLGLSASVGDKLARLLMQWCDGATGSGPIRITRHYTHGEIAEMIGTSRETVTRLLKEFRDSGLITQTKTELCIPDRRRLKSTIGSKHRNGNGQNGNGHNGNGQNGNGHNGNGHTSTNI